MKFRNFKFVSFPLLNKPGFTTSIPNPFGFKIDSKPIFKTALLAAGAFTARAGIANADNNPKLNNNIDTLLSNTNYNNNHRNRFIKTIDNDVDKKISTNIIDKNLIDNRNYKAFTLSNGLRVLLISDSTINRASAAIDVHVGSFSDPDDLPGLAHFAEHMCFLGTKKYPEEDDFSKYLSSHGGSSNAYTDSEDTVYFFNCDDIAFEGALDRFSNFFISPSFEPSAVGRELNAIDSEHSKNKNDDYWRMHQLECDEANPKHPLHKFTTGNKETLLTIPKSKGINVRDELIKFHKKYYISNQMTLCIQSSQSINQLEKWVIKYFNNIPSNVNSKSPSDEWIGKISPFLPQNDNLVNQISIVPVVDMRLLKIQFPIWIKNSNDKNIILKHKPEAYLSYLFSDQGENSLRTKLVEKNWINEVGAGVVNDISDMVEFEIRIDLTENGLKHTTEIIDIIFTYLEFLKNEPLPNYILNEYNQLAELAWNYRGKESGMDFVSRIASNMQVYAPISYLSGAYLFEPNEIVIQDYLKQLNVDNAHIKLVSSSLKGKTDKIEKIYGTEYTSKLLQSESKRWKSISNKDTNKYNFQYRKSNSYIPKNFELLQPPVLENDSKYLETLFQPPKLIQSSSSLSSFSSNNKLNVWYKMDRSFAQPKVCAVIYMSLPLDLYSPKFQVMKSLYPTLLKDGIRQFLDETGMASLDSDIDFGQEGGLFIRISGFNDNILNYTESLIKKIKEFVPDKEAFERYKEKTLRQYDSFKFNQPYIHARYLQAMATESLQFTIEELRPILLKLNVNDFKDFLNNVTKRSSGFAIVEGNINELDALKMINLIENEFQFQKLDTKDQARNSPIKIPLAPSSSLSLSLNEKNNNNNGIEQGYRIKRKEFNEKDENSAVKFEFQVPSRKIEDYMMVYLLGESLERPFFFELRTQQQLGYIVGSGTSFVKAIPSLVLTVQSAVVDGDELCQRIESWIKDKAIQEIEKLDDKDFKDTKDAIIRQNNQPDRTLYGQVNRFYGEIYRGYFESSDSNDLNFDRRLEENKFLNGVTKQQLIDFARKLLLPGGELRRLMVSQVNAQTISPDRLSINENNSNNYGKYIEIDDPKEFKKSLEFL